MYFDNYDLIPSVGIKDIKIGMSLKAIEEILKIVKFLIKKKWTIIKILIERHGYSLKLKII